MKCLDLPRLLEYQNKLLNESTSEKVRQHLQTCARCQELEKKLQGLTNSFQRFSLLNKTMETSQCYDDLQILSIIEGKSTKQEEKKFYHHLSVCPLCLEQLISLENFVEDLRTESIIPSNAGKKFQPKQIFDKLKNSLADRIHWIRHTFQIPRPAFHFAGLLVILIIFVILLHDRGEKIPYSFKKDEPVAKQLQPTVQSLEDGGNIIPNSYKTREPVTHEMHPVVQLLEPSNKSAIGTERLQFHWNQVTNATSYTFLLLNEQGNIIWEEKTTNTNLTLPQEIHLQPSGKYFWQVECFFDQGGSIISELASFSIIDR